jgi:DNA-binding NarL/FixJ family response regulator
MGTRVFVVAPTPVTRAGLRSMLANAEGAEVRVVGEEASPTDLSALSEAHVILLADEELLEEVSIAVAEDGTQAVVLVSEEEHAVPRLRAMQLKGWGVVPPDAPPEELAAAVAAAGQV